MKKSLLLGLAIGAVAVTATSAFALITGSKHDLSFGGDYPATYTNVDNVSVDDDRICIYCHTPHNAVRAGGALSYSPLWNRAFAANTPYVMYNNGTGDDYGILTDSDSDGIVDMVVDTDASNGNTDTAFQGDGSVNRHMMNGVPAMTGISLLCMSCHDGVTALNAYSDGTGIKTDKVDQGSILISDYYIIGQTSDFVGGQTTKLAREDYVGDLSNHHPIGMSWSDSEKDPEINSRNTPFMANLTIEDVLQGGDTFTCASCHDVHNADDNEDFLHISNTKSEFCLVCHKK